MNCLEVGALLEALHDGALDSETTKSVEVHLSACTSCGVELTQLRMVSDLLQKSRIPVPSSSLDVRLMTAFRQQHRRTSRWRTWVLFSGSILIPKPALVFAAIIIAVGLVGAVKVGMMASAPAVVNVALPEASPSNPKVPQQAAPEVRIVEVPIIRERVRTIYVAASRRSQPRNKDLFPGARDLAMNGSVGEKGYFTRVNLSGFLPASEMKTRVISEVKPNEK